MMYFRLERRQTLPASIESAWMFFSSPHNLPLITPPWLNLKITSKVPHTIDPGMRISYRITPFFGIPVTWISEITHVEPPVAFIDEQSRGPYRIWRHEHHFRKVGGGVEVRDRITYALNFGVLGRFTHAVLVRRRLETIFDYRRQALEDHSWETP